MRAYITMLAGLVVAVVLVFDIAVHRPVVDATGTQTSHAAKTTMHQSVKAAATPSKLVEDLLPEQDDLSTFLLAKLATPPPPPPPDCQVESCLALTFDDGPGTDSSPIILSALEKGRAHATFFVIGSKIGPNGTILQRMQSDGDDIGNHSWTHPYFTKLPIDQVQQQIDLTQAAITAAGVRAPILLRPPYGAINQTIASHLNMPVIMWNVDPKDWAQKDPNTIAQMVESQAKPGAIIVMHDKPLTAAAMDKIVSDLKTKFRLVTVSQLLGVDANSRGIFFGR